MVTIATADEGTKRLAHYIICHTEPSSLGATKLNKVMWHADVAHYRKNGATISGQMSYRRWDNGPMPHNINDAIRELAREGKVLERSQPTMSGTRREFLWLEPCNLDQFSSAAIEDIHTAIQAVCPLSAKKASERTHDSLWAELLNGEQMSVRAAAVQPTEIEPDELAWVLEEAEKLNGSQSAP